MAQCVRMVQNALDMTPVVYGRVVMDFGVARSKMLCVALMTIIVVDKTISVIIENIIVTVTSFIVFQIVTNI